MPEEFIAQVAQPTKDIKYVGGGAGSMFDPGEIAERILPDLRGGQLFAYLFRRFGYPSIGWDSDKELVNYLITTPVKNVFLLIIPYMGSDHPHGKSSSYDSTELMFGYFLPKVVERVFYSCFKSSDGYDVWEGHPLYKEINQAFEVAMRDLLRPVYVRDVRINCYGRADEGTERLPHVEASSAAGYPIPYAFFKNTVRWKRFTNALITLGGGSMEEGIEDVIKAASQKQE